MLYMNAYILIVLHTCIRNTSTSSRLHRYQKKHLHLHVSAFLVQFYIDVGGVGGAAVKLPTVSKRLIKENNNHKILVDSCNHGNITD
jgi:hypothetical protein